MPQQETPGEWQGMHAGSPAGSHEVETVEIDPATTCRRLVATVENPADLRVIANAKRFRKIAFDFYDQADYYANNDDADIPSLSGEDLAFIETMRAEMALDGHNATQPPAVDPCRALVEHMARMTEYSEGDSGADAIDTLNALLREARALTTAAPVASSTVDGSTQPTTADARAARAWDAYCAVHEEGPDIRDNPDVGNLALLLADLRHWAAARGFSYERADSLADTHFVQEDGEDASEATE